MDSLLSDSVDPALSSALSSEEREALAEPEDLSLLTAIQNRYTFWYRCDLGEKGKVQRNNYFESIKKVASFQTVERFWSIYDHMKRPHEFKNAEFHLFKEGIEPTWEDPQNKVGGKWSVRLPKGVASRYWEDILLAIIGEQFDVGYEICGAVVSVRSNEDIISVWNKTADNKEAVEKIRDQIRKFVRLPPVIPIEYKRHQMSLEEGSSYKNPTMVWRPSAKANASGHHNFHNNNNFNAHHHQPNFDRGHGEHGNKPFHHRTNTFSNNAHHAPAASTSHPAAASSEVPQPPRNAWKTNKWDHHDREHTNTTTTTGPGWRRPNQPRSAVEPSGGGGEGAAAAATPAAPAVPAPLAAPTGASSSKPYSTNASASGVPASKVLAAPGAPLTGWTRVANPFGKPEST